DDDVRVRSELAELGQRREAVHARHADVEKHQIELGIGEGPQRAVAVLHRHDVIAGLPQALLQHPAQAVLIVSDQDPRDFGIHGHGSGLAAATGRKHVTVVPRPSSLSMSMAPRCCSTIWWQMARPRPRPWSFVVKKGSKMRARAAGGIPVPSSMTCASTMLRCPP